MLISCDSGNIESMSLHAVSRAALPHCVKRGQPLRWISGGSRMPSTVNALDMNVR
jgi:hypothetical protein